jgi:AcrR family transcriptional regulator
MSASREKILTVSRSYHHGNLRRVLIDGALDAIAEKGAAALSLRDVARRAGVSHAAPAHHFGDKKGLLTAIAVEGFDGLTDATRAAAGDHVAGGLAWIGWALEHPAHYEVMFTPGLLRLDDPELVRARAEGAEVLLTSVRGRGVGEEVVGDAALASMAWAHGFIGLWQTGNLAGLGTDPIALASRSAAALGRLASRA